MRRRWARWCPWPRRVRASRGARRPGSTHRLPELPLWAAGLVRLPSEGGAMAGLVSRETAGVPVETEPRGEPWGGPVSAERWASVSTSRVNPRPSPGAGRPVDARPPGRPTSTPGGVASGRRGAATIVGPCLGAWTAWTADHRRADASRADASEGRVPPTEAGRARARPGCPFPTSCASAARPPMAGPPAPAGCGSPARAIGQCQRQHPAMSGRTPPVTPGSPRLLSGGSPSCPTGPLARFT